MTTVMITGAARGLGLELTAGRGSPGTIDGFTTKHNGRYIQYDGTELSW